MRKSWFIGMLMALVLVCTASALPDGVLRRRLPPADYADQVSNLFSQHRWAKGKEILDVALEYYPDDANLHYLAGRYWWNGKNYDRSRYHLVKACQINYHHVDAKSLLVNVEEITGNYSSAVCYVNELLEVNPYWKGLWLRKVDLYKKMGNFEEANVLLRRLSQIYPNDASISGDFLEVLETTYNQARVNGDLNAAEEALKEIVRLSPSDVDYQLAYANILIRRGRYNDALDNLSAALTASPGNVELIRKSTDILMETGRNMSALALVRSQMAQYPNPALNRLLEQLLVESSRMENDADPYQLYSRVYGASGSMESLDYLLTQSVRRGYDEDALFYIAEMRRKTGPTPRLSLMEYEVYRRMGRSEGAVQALEEGAELFPDNYDLNLALSRLKLADAADLMESSRYADAIPKLQFVVERCGDEGLRQLALRRLTTCFRETNQPGLAEQSLRDRLAFDPEYVVTTEYAALRRKQGQTEDGLNALVASYQQAEDSLSRRKLANAYIEMAYPYIREKMDVGSYTGVLEICDQMLEMEPDNYWALHYAIRMSRNPMPYVDRGMAAYPEDLSFPIKKAQLLAIDERYEEALAILSPMLNRYPGDDELNKTYASIADDLAMRAFREKDLETAAAYLDTALTLRPLDAPIRYNRGLVYERNHQWDSAYYYQRTYVPSVLEEKEFKAHMDALRSRMLKNTVDVGMDLYRFSDSYRFTGVASVGYSHAWKQDELQARIQYTGRDASKDEESGRIVSPGGRGLQFIAGWTHHFGANWTVEGSAGYATAFFPRVLVNTGATWHLPYDWDAEGMLQYRMLTDGSHMMGLQLGGSRAWEHIYAGAKVSTGLLHKIVYVNGSARVRFYPYEGGRSYLEAQAGAGTAPEIDFLQYYYNTAVYNHLNSFVACTASWQVAYNMMLQLSGSWNTLYDQQKSVSYRNLFLVHVSVAVSF